jgi:hypothetical protein
MLIHKGDLVKLVHTVDDKEFTETYLVLEEVSKWELFLQKVKLNFDTGMFPGQLKLRYMANAVNELK